MKFIVMYKKMSLNLILASSCDKNCIARCWEFLRNL